MSPRDDDTPESPRDGGRDGRLFKYPEWDEVRQPRVSTPCSSLSRPFAGFSPMFSSALLHPPSVPFPGFLLSICCA